MAVLDDRQYLEDWLKTGSSELANVPATIKMAAFYFTLLWSLFDLRRLGRSGSRDIVEKYCSSISEGVNFEPFQSAWEHFQGRFANATGVTDHFRPLIGDDYKTEKILRPILVAQQGTPKDKLSALVFITFRLRCNLVHGDKYKTGMNDQYHNLMQGAKLMTLLLDTPDRTQING